MRVLVVEDNRKVAAFIVKGLQEEAWAVDHAMNGEDALRLVAHNDYDVVVLDLMLPGISGLQVLQSVRKSKKSLPVLILTAMDSVSDKVKGLDAGADDYLTKPFSFEELLARLRALLRRGSAQESNRLSLDDLVVDLLSREVRRGERRIVLTAKEYALLIFLLRNAGRVMSRTAIVGNVWDMQYDSETNVVDVLIRYLRRKIDDDSRVKLIHSVRGAGYVMKVEGT